MSSLLPLFLMWRAHRLAIGLPFVFRLKRKPPATSSLHMAATVGSSSQLSLLLLPLALSPLISLSLLLADYCSLMLYQVASSSEVCGFAACGFAAGAGAARAVAASPPVPPVPSPPPASGPRPPSSRYFVCEALAAKASSSCVLSCSRRASHCCVHNNINCPRMNTTHLHVQRISHSRLQGFIRFELSCGLRELVRSWQGALPSYPRPAPPPAGHAMLAAERIL